MQKRMTPRVSVDRATNIDALTREMVALRKVFMSSESASDSDRSTLWFSGRAAVIVGSTLHKPARTLAVRLD